MNSELERQDTEWTASFLPTEAPSNQFMMPPPVAVPMRQSSSTALSLFEPLKKVRQETSILAACFNGASRRPIRSCSKLLSFVPQRKRRPSAKANIIPARRHKIRPCHVLSSWDKTFLEFLTLPATHRYLKTGRVVPRRKLCVWGRQNTYRPPAEGLPDTMIRMDSKTGISFADPKEMDRMGQFLQDQRRLHKPMPFAPIDLSPDNYERGMDEQFKRMEQIVRSELLQLVGLEIDADQPSIVPSPLLPPTATKPQMGESGSSRQQVAKDNTAASTTLKQE